MKQIARLFPLLEPERTCQFLAQLRDHHAETFHHSVRVARWSHGFAREFGPHQDEDARILVTGALLHDVGKLQIPRDVLGKATPLEPDEWRLIEQHPRLGFDLTRGLFDEGVRQIIVGHHELKHGPYPRREGRECPDPTTDLLVSIVAVADIYDALRFRRSYKGPLASSEIRDLLASQFAGDPRLPEQMVAVGSLR